MRALGQLACRPKGFGLFLAFLAASAAAQPAGEWMAYGRTAAGDRHSPLTQINPANVGQLQVAWRYHTGVFPKGNGHGRPPRLAATPVVADGRMFIVAPTGLVVALDPATGRELWRFEGKVDDKAGFGDNVSRGVSYWRDPVGNGRCAARVLAPMLDGRLIALAAADGRRCTGFGANGEIDLRVGLRNAPRNASEFELTSPPAVIGDVIVAGSAVPDNGRLDSTSGEVRGYDARTGKLLWTWDPVPQDAKDPAYATWQGPVAHRTGGANAWSVIAGDAARHLAFVPTTSPSVDYWGGSRLGDNRHANSIVALDTRTGKLRWAFQTVHHDLWDFDNAAPPALVEVTIGGKRRAAVLQATKTGQLFVLDRDTGKPLIPVVERPVPASDAAGEVASKTQPFSTLPALSPHSLTAADLARNPDPAHRDQCLAALAKLRNEGTYTPPSERGTLVMPSNVGGAHWGGLAFVAQAGVAVVPVNTMAAVITLLPREKAEAIRAAKDDGERIGLEYASMRGSPYVLKRELFFAGGRPCTPPPYGELHAIDIAKKTTLWRVPLGDGAGTPFKGAVGMLNLGGPISTASGLIFLAASPNPVIRAFDAKTGRELWAGKLPAGARATPMTYAAGGRQFVAIAAAGDGEIFGYADEIVAFALPSPQNTSPSSSRTRGSTNTAQAVKGPTVEANR